VPSIPLWRHLSAEYDDNLVVRHAVSWPYMGPPVVMLITLGEIGARLAPPASDVSTWSFGAAAVLLTVKLLCWIATSHRSFDRHDRLAAFVMLVAIAMGWYATMQWVHEREFDYVVAAQNASLKLTAAQLSASILAFVAERGRHAPPAPRPPTWNQDEAAFASYETETVKAFERRFGKPTRVAHDIFGQLGIRDKDFDVFYAHPANAFQMRIVGMKLAALAAKVPG
jgi:hypothetical protein